MTFAPAAWYLWERQQAANIARYAGFPLHSCSVDGHDGAAAFRDFIAPILRPLGSPQRYLRVLDVGCGPQPLPAYLEGHPLSLIAGIDPLEPTGAPHPFEFVTYYAEKLPWPDATFGAVLAATSLDHVFDLPAALREAHRVLAPGGRFLVWCTLWPDAEAPEYDPLAPPAEMADECHVYHLGAWFLHLARASGFQLVRHERPAGSTNDYLEFSPR